MHTDTTLAMAEPGQRHAAPDQKVAAFVRTVLPFAAMAAVVLLGMNFSKAAGLDIRQTFAARPASIAAGTELRGCLSNTMHRRITPGKDDWLLERLVFQEGSWGVMMFELVGDPALRTTTGDHEVHSSGDCLVIKLTDAPQIGNRPDDYVVMGNAEIVRVISIDESSRSKFFKLGGEPKL